MFKCKGCGKQFGANAPRVCSGCGETIGERTSGWGVVGALVVAVFSELTGWVILLLAGVGAGALVYFLW